MRPHEPNNIGDNKPPARRRNYLLFFFQHEGQHSHLRFTPLGATVFVLIIVVPIIALLILFFINSRTPGPQVNTSITVQPAAPYSPNTPRIRQPPPPSPVKPIKQPSMPRPPTLSTPINDANKQLAPRQTPRPTPSESPP